MNTDRDYKMSEKAKGKQRAYPINTDAAAHEEIPLISPVPPPKLSLVIRFADGTPDLRLEMAPTETGANILHEIRQHRQDLKDKRLRLIHAGRSVLGHTSLSALRPKELPEEHQEPERRLSLSSWSPREKTRPTRSSTEIPEKHIIWLHCAIGETVDPTVGQEATQAAADTPQVYDRFTDAGLSQADVQSIRSLFRRVMFGTNAGGPEAPSTSEYAPSAEQANILEARWLESITQPSAYEETVDRSAPPSPSLLSRIVSYILPTTAHPSPARSATQGLIFAFLFPFIAGVVIDYTSRPPAFFDGGIWPELSDGAIETIVSSESATVESSGGNRERTNGADPTQSTERQEHEATDNVANPDPDTTQAGVTESRANRLRSIAPDIIVDPVPTNVFSEGMQAAIRAGLLLNFVAGFYLWLYA